MSFNIFLAPGTAKPKPTIPRVSEEPVKHKTEQKQEEPIEQKPKEPTLDIPQVIRCESHRNTDATAFCFDCLRPTCYECIEHADHTIQPILEAKPLLSKKLVFLKDELSDLKEANEKAYMKIQIEKAEGGDAVKIESEGKIQQLTRDKNTLEEEITELKQVLEEKRLKVMEITQEIRVLNQKTHLSTQNFGQKKLDDLYVEEKESQAKAKACDNMIDLIQKSIRISSSEAMITAVVRVRDDMSAMKMVVKSNVVPVPQVIKTDGITSPRGYQTIPKSSEPQLKPNEAPGWMQNVKKRDIFAEKDEPVVVKEPVKAKPRPTGLTEIDPTLCTLTGKTFRCAKDQDLSFELTAKNCEGTTLDVDMKSSFKFRLLDYPEDYTPKIRVTTKDQPQGTMGIIFVADRPLTYVLKIEHDETEIAGSPFSIEVVDEIVTKTGADSYTLPEICHYAGCWNSSMNCFMIKTNVMGNSISCYDIGGAHVKTIELPIALWSLSTDATGMIYGGDNKKGFYKFDQSGNQIWAKQVEEKYAVGVSCIDEFVFAMLHRGPIFVLEQSSGTIVKTIKPESPFVYAFNLLVTKTHILVGDKKEIIVLDKEGKVEKNVSGFDSCSFAQMNEDIYVCNNKTKLWNKFTDL